MHVHMPPITIYITKQLTNWQHSECHDVWPCANQLRVTAYADQTSTNAAPKKSLRTTDICIYYYIKWCLMLKSNAHHIFYASGIDIDLPNNINRKIYVKARWRLLSPAA